MDETTEVEVAEEQIPESTGQVEHVFTEEEQNLLDSQAAEEAQAAQAATAAAEAKESKERAETEDKPWFKKRMDEMARKAGEATRENERLRAVIEQAALKPQQPQSEPEVSQPPPETRPRPTMESCEFDESRFIEELTDWKLEQRDVAQEVERANNQAAAQQQTHQELFEQKKAECLTTGIDKFPDFEEVVYALPPEVLDEKLATAVLETKAPSDVFYYLATNPGEAAKLAKMNLAHLLLELGRLESKAIVATPGKKQTNAPPPVKPVGKTAPVGTEPDAKTDPEAYFKFLQGKAKARGTRY